MQRVLVIGGAGCLGSHAIEVLHERRKELGVEEIIVLDLANKVTWASAEDNARIQGYCSQWHAGSILDIEDIERAIKGCNAVLHFASMVDTGAVDKQLVYNVNVNGTRNVIEACKNEPTCSALVYSSTLDVVIACSNFVGISGGNEETCPYAMHDPNQDHESDVYGTSKSISEQAVLQANSAKLRTCAVRPVGLYGERDTIHIGSVLTVARDLGRMPFVGLGNFSAVFQHVYARNCAWMHILAAKQLADNNVAVAGQAFFGIDDTKVNNFFYFFKPYLAQHGYAIPRVGIPGWLLYPFAAVVEDLFYLTRRWLPWLMRGAELRFTRRAIQGTCVTQWFETDKARRLLGYIPLNTPQEARERTLKFFKTKMDLFPLGPHKYKPGEYDYVDDGVDYRPF